MDLHFRRQAMVVIESLCYLGNLLEVISEDVNWT